MVNQAFLRECKDDNIVASCDHKLCCTYMDIAEERCFPMYPHHVVLGLDARQHTDHLCSCELKTMML